MKLGVVILLQSSLLLGLASKIAMGSSMPVCRGGKPVEEIVVAFQTPIYSSKVGTPLDVALKQERRQVESARLLARRYFIENRHPVVSELMERYTLVLPSALRERYGIVDLLVLDDIELAVRFRRMIWRHYSERFTTIRESPGRNPYVINFEVRLDLTLFCRYGRPVADLVVPD